jgi:hypothetical protein
LLHLFRDLSPFGTCLQLAVNSITPQGLTSLQSLVNSTSRTFLVARLHPHTPAQGARGSYRRGTPSHPCRREDKCLPTAFAMTNLSTTLTGDLALPSGRLPNVRMPNNKMANCMESLQISATVPWPPQVAHMELQLLISRHLGFWQAQLPWGIRPGQSGSRAPCEPATHPDRRLRWR